MGYYHTDDAEDVMYGRAIASGTLRSAPEPNANAVTRDLPISRR